MPKPAPETMPEFIGQTGYKPPPIRPLAAIRALHRLMRDPQDTRQVALLTSALRGRSGLTQYLRFKAAPAGVKILAEKRILAETLDNHAYLATLPEHSFGRAYLAFMAQENLTAKGLQAATTDATSGLHTADENIQIFAGRTRDLHDLYHVLTGYGRDEFGEICVLAFCYPQQRLRSFAAIAALGAFNLSRRLLSHKISPRGVLPAVLQAYRNGARATWLPGEDIEALLTENLQSLRQRLNILPPNQYTTLIARLHAQTTWRTGPIFNGQSLINPG